MVTGLDGVRVSWVSVAAGRRLLGVSRQRVHQLCESGQLASTVIEGQRMVSVASIEARIGQRRLEGIGE